MNFVVYRGNALLSVSVPLLSVLIWWGGGVGVRGGWRVGGCRAAQMGPTSL